jgi:hypothetical protein
MRLSKIRSIREKSMPTTSHLPDQPIMKYVHPADRLRPWFGVAVGLAALVVMLAFGILGRNFGTLEHLGALNDAGGWLTVSLIEASAGILRAPRRRTKRKKGPKISAPSTRSEHQKRTSNPKLRVLRRIHRVDRPD